MIKMFHKMGQLFVKLGFNFNVVNMTLIFQSETFWESKKQDFLYEKKDE